MKNLRAVLAMAVFALTLSAVPTMVQAGPPPPSPGVVPYPGKNLNESLLILDYASMSAGQVVQDEAACQDACKAHYGCNGYTYCTLPSGCGGACNQYVSGKGGKLLPPSGGSTNYKSQSLPVVVPGSFSPLPNGCNADGSWPYRLCSLKKVANPDVPNLYPDLPSAGWTSGVLKDLNGGSSCNSMPFGVCAACAAFWTPAPTSTTFSDCLSCANAVTASLGAAGADTIEKSTAHWACTWCLSTRSGDLNYNRAACFTCAGQNARTGLPNLCVR